MKESLHDQKAITKGTPNATDSIKNASRSCKRMHYNKASAISASLLSVITVSQCDYRTSVLLTP